jgi:hypothetical protein
MIIREPVTSGFGLVAKETPIEIKEMLLRCCIQKADITERHLRKGSMGPIFGRHLWTGLSVWIALYICDYTMTIICARLYGNQDRIRFEGSYEITPYYQRDINSLKKLSPRFLAALAFIAGLISLNWYATRELDLPQWYAFVLGAMILVQLGVQKRHFQNFFLFRAIVSGSGLQGSITYPRHMILRQSAVDFFSFAGLYAITFAFTGSWFLLGGAVGCLSVALKHLRLAKAFVRSAAATA